MNNNRGIFLSAHIADIHFGAFNPKLQFELLTNQFLSKIYTVPGLNLISINGDLFDHKLMGNSDAIYYASIFIDQLVKFVRERGITLLLLHGTYSHDSDQLKLFYHYCEDTTVDVRIVNQIEFQQVGNCRVLCIPELYNVPDETYDLFLHRSYPFLLQIQRSCRREKQDHQNRDISDKLQQGEGMDFPFKFVYYGTN